MRWTGLPCFGGGSFIGHGGGDAQEVHELRVRRAGPDGGGGRGVEEGLAAAIRRRLRSPLRQVRVGI